MDQISEMAMEYLIALLTLSKQKLEYKVKVLFSLGKYYRLICLEEIPFLELRIQSNPKGFLCSVSFVMRHNE